MLTEVKLPSERVVRVVSSMIAPVEISWVETKKGYDSLYVNFNFVLMDENGELHLPKDQVCETASSKASTIEACTSLPFDECLPHICMHRTVA